MALNVATVALAILVSFDQFNAYTIDYYDCREIDTVTTYKLTKACSPRTLERTETVAYTILQKKKVRSLTGYSCRISRSTLTQYCGAYSHTKLAKTPDVEVTHQTTPTQCLNIVNTGMFTTPSGARYEVSMNAQSVLKSEEKGTLTIGDNSVSCRGQTMRFPGNYIVDDILEVSQYKVTLLEEKFIVSDDGRVETVADHLRLPTRCTVASRGCQIHDTTYVWQPPRDQCNLEEVRTVHMEEDGEFLVDYENKVLLKTGNTVPAPVGCPTTLLFATEYSNLYLATPGVKWSKMDDDADITTFIKARDDYLAFEMEKRMADQEAQTKSRICHDSLKDRQNELVQLEGPSFLRRNGDAVEHFKCAQKTAALTENLEVCYDEIPIAGGFVKVTRHFPATTYRF